MATRRVLMLVTAGRKDEANAVALGFDAVGGMQTFTVGLSRNGRVPFSHYWASADMTDETLAQVKGLASTRFRGDASVLEYDLDTEANVPETVAAGRGLITLRVTSVDAR